MRILESPRSVLQHYGHYLTLARRFMNTMLSPQGDTVADTLPGDYSQLLQERQNKRIFCRTTTWPVSRQYGSHEMPYVRCNSVSHQSSFSGEVNVSRNLKSSTAVSSWRLRFPFSCLQTVTSSESGSEDVENDPRDGKSQIDSGLSDVQTQDLEKSWKLPPRTGQPSTAVTPQGSQLGRAAFFDIVRRTLGHIQSVGSNFSSRSRKGSLDQKQPSVDSQQLTISAEVEKWVSQPAQVEVLPGCTSASGSSVAGSSSLCDQGLSSPCTGYAAANVQSMHQGVGADNAIGANSPGSVDPAGRNSDLKAGHCCADRPEPEASAAGVYGGGGRAQGDSDVLDCGQERDSTKATHFFCEQCEEITVVSSPPDRSTAVPVQHGAQSSPGITLRGRHAERAATSPSGEQNGPALVARDSDGSSGVGCSSGGGMNGLKGAHAPDNDCVAHAGCADAVPRCSSATLPSGFEYVSPGLSDLEDCGWLGT